MWADLKLYCKSLIAVNTAKKYGLHRWVSLTGKHSPYLQLLSLGMPRCGIQTASSSASVALYIKNPTVSRQVEQSVTEPVPCLSKKKFQAMSVLPLGARQSALPRPLFFCSKCPITNLKQIQRATAWRCVPVFVFVPSQ